MGMAMQPGVPHLAGQPQMYVAEQLKNYRSGKRPHEVMAVIAKTLTDADIEALSHWYAAIAIKLE
jgi:cytochrome c553